MSDRPDLKDPEAVKAFILASIAKGFARAPLDYPATTVPVEGHDGHRTLELPTGGMCNRRVVCVTCGLYLIDTFEPVEFVQINIRPEGA